MRRWKGLVGANRWVAAQNWTSVPGKQVASQATSRQRMQTWYPLAFVPLLFAHCHAIVMSQLPVSSWTQQLRGQDMWAIGRGLEEREIKGSRAGKSLGQGWERQKEETHPDRLPCKRSLPC